MKKDSGLLDNIIDDLDIFPKKMTSRIRIILSEMPNMRDDDNLLIAKYQKLFGKITAKQSASIIRLRARVQQEDDTLRGEKYQDRATHAKKVANAFAGISKQELSTQAFNLGFEGGLKKGRDEHMKDIKVWKDAVKKYNKETEESQIKILDTIKETYDKGYEDAKKFLESSHNHKTEIITIPTPKRTFKNLFGLLG